MATRKFIAWFNGYWLGAERVVWLMVASSPGPLRLQRFAAFLQRVVRKRRAHAQYGSDQIRHLPCNQAPL